MCLTNFVQNGLGFRVIDRLGRVNNLSVKRVDLVGFDAVLFDRLGDFFYWHGPFFAQSFERSDHDLCAQL